MRLDTVARSYVDTKMKLGRGEIEVWVASLSALEPKQLGELESTLSADEVARADKFYFERDRRSFIGRRGILRAILAAYLGTKPSALRFLYNEFGKPRLEASTEAARNLSFNLSHSGGLALVAVAIDREVGIDLELIDSTVASGEVAKRFFSKNEVAALEAMPLPMRLAGFFNCWARKEAYIKARGMGLSIPLDSFDVSLMEGEATDLAGIENSSDTRSWKIEGLDVDPRYGAAIAAPGRDWKVVRRSWPS